MKITKSDFLTYSSCPSDFWFSKHLPQVRIKKPVDEFTQQIIDQGSIIEAWANKIFPDGKTVQAYGQSGAEWTAKYMAEGTKTIYQATFVYDDLEIRVDILQKNEWSGGWDLIEVKASTFPTKKKKRNPDYILDATFQKIVLENCNLKVDNVYLVEVNSEYIRQGEIEADQLLHISEITTEVLDVESTVRADIEAARALVQSKKPPKSCQCRYLPRKRQCAIHDYLYPNTPSYGVYDIVRIGLSKKKLAVMVDEGSLTLDQVTEEHDLTKPQMNQVETYVHDDIIFDHNGISDELNTLVYPLYFLDYETYAPAVPAYDDTHPYQHVTVQYSLHIQQAPDAPYTHHEYLHNDTDTPMHILAKRLREDIGDTGSVIVWNKSFEAGRNKDLAGSNPELKEFLLGLNDRMFDLELIFKKQHYVHKDFRGKTSIKSVLPVLCPELSYDGLLIVNGGAATTMWPKMIFGDIPEEERQEIYDGLLEYCKLDTWAMVRILEEVRGGTAQR